MAFKLTVIFLSLVVICQGKSIESSPFQNELYPYPRIVGGELVGENERPEAVSLVSGTWRSLVCGGSLLNEMTILTAAHCTDALLWQIQAGAAFACVGSNIYGSNQEYQITGRQNHPNWDSDSTKSDIGLLFINFKIPITNLVRPIHLHEPVVEGQVDVNVYGWGRVVHGGAVSQQLKKLSTKTLSHNDCVTLRNEAQESYPWNLPAISPLEEICSFHSHGSGNCHGDSGGPLIIHNTNQQVGVVSWGVPCAIGGPDVYVRVSSFVEWLKANLRE